MLGISKHRFHFYPGLVRPADQEMSATKNTLLQFPRGGGTPCHAGLPREAPGSIRRQRETGNEGKRSSCGFNGEEQVRQGEQA